MDIKSIEQLHGRRVKLVRVDEKQGTWAERTLLNERLGDCGIAKPATVGGDSSECVLVVFEDGRHFRCLPEELELTVQKPIAVAAVREAKLTPRYVQSCLAHLSFPTDLAGLRHARNNGNGWSDLESTLWPPEDGSGDWTAPRWLTDGDVMFFYHTKKAIGRIEKLLKAATDPKDKSWDSEGDRDELIAYLDDQLALADGYAGTIFGCALVAGSAHVQGRHKHQHWDSTIYAPLAEVHPFQYPLPDSEFRRFVTISPGGAVTPIHGETFVELKAALAKHNELPDYLSNALPGGLSFRDVNAKNWIEIACNAEARFIDESQLRAYLVDHVLEAIKDPRTSVHQECRCEGKSAHACFADYYVRIGGVWIAVEAKLNVRAERDLPGQVSKYVNAEQFTPTRGAAKGKIIKGPCAPYCLVADALGLYVVTHNGFVECSAEQPLWRRSSITRPVLEDVRRHLQAMVSA